MSEKENNKYDKSIIIEEIVKELKKVDLVYDLLVIKMYLKKINNKTNKK